MKQLFKAEIENENYNQSVSRKRNMKIPVRKNERKWKNMLMT